MGIKISKRTVVGQYIRHMAGTKKFRKSHGIKDKDKELDFWKKYLQSALDKELIGKKEYAELKLVVKSKFK